MKRLATTTGGAWGFLVLGLLFSAAIPTAQAWAQTPTASAFGIAVSTPTTSSTSALAVLPTDGSLGSANAPSASVGGVAGADNLFAIATGSEGSAESNSTLENVSLLSGLITADGVTALASSALWDGGGVGYVLLNEQIPSGDGVTSSGLTVNMIHVVLLDALTGAQTGEIIVGSATSSVN